MGSAAANVAGTGNPAAENAAIIFNISRRCIFYLHSFMSINPSPMPHVALPYAGQQQCVAVRRHFSILFPAFFKIPLMLWHKKYQKIFGSDDLKHKTELAVPAGVQQRHFPHSPFHSQNRLRQQTSHTEQSIMKICRSLPQLAVALLICALPCRAALAFDFNDVARLARDLANAPYKKPENKLPKELRELPYDQYRQIRFKAERAHWRTSKALFELTFHPQGQQFSEPVKISEISADGISEIRFNPDDFDFGPVKIDPQRLQGLGFAGFRVHYPINATNRKDEIISFLGASYFRGVGKGQVRGLAARGLAVDTALMSGEEFPRFVEFWIERPSPTARELVVYALLDSKSLAGAYRFVLRPGNDTITDVRARLYPREHVAKLGLAPLTSMYDFGENQRSGTEDFRPEVHDSDGLSVQSGTGEWLWRPLVNPKRLLVTSFTMTNPQGFGLMQRDRAFSSYEDLDRRYDLRPSAWVEPRGRWGTGRIELVQIPTPDETNDNIVAYWVPADPLQPKQAYDFEYRLTWQRDAEARPPLSWVTQTRRSMNPARKPDNSTTLSVDFAGPALDKLPADARPQGVASIDANGEILENTIRRNSVTGGWRVTLRVRQIDIKKPVEMRAFLRHDNNTLSETWSYILPAA